MRKELIEILACPVCKGTLQLNVEQQDGGEIVKGSLYCPMCNAHYPIVDGIPNLLPTNGD